MTTLTTAQFEVIRHLAHAPKEHALEFVRYETSARNVAIGSLMLIASTRVVNALVEKGLIVQVGTHIPAMRLTDAGLQYCIDKGLIESPVNVTDADAIETERTKDLLAEDAQARLEAATPSPRIPRKLTAAQFSDITALAHRLHQWGSHRWQGEFFMATIGRNCELKDLTSDEAALVTEALTDLEAKIKSYHAKVGDIARNWTAEFCEADTALNIILKHDVYPGDKERAEMTYREICQRAALKVTHGRTSSHKHMTLVEAGLYGVELQRAADALMRENLVKKEARRITRTEYKALWLAIRQAWLDENNVFIKPEEWRDAYQEAWEQGLEMYMDNPSFGGWVNLERRREWQAKYWELSRKQSHVYRNIPVE